jgi:tripartite ATP-independent transporter DctM subunit
MRLTSAETAAIQTAWRAVLVRVVGWVHEIMRVVIVLALLAELVVVVSDVLGRSMLAHSLLWSDEAAKLALSVITFVGGAVGYRDGLHTRVEVIVNRLPRSASAAVVLGTEWLVVILAAAVSWASLDLLEVHWGDYTPMMKLSTAWYILPCTVGMGLIALYGLERLATRYRPLPMLAVGVVVGAVVLAFEYAMPLPFFAQNPATALTAMIGLFFAAVLLGMPVSFAMLLGTLSYLQATDMVPALAVPQNMVDGISNFILLALPFFIFAGLIMEKGGISVRLIRFAMVLVGRLRGGLLQVVVVTIFMVSGISGSKIADVAAVGAVIRDELRKRGYSLDEGAAVLAASAAMAETIPPSIAMLVLGSVTSVSIGTLFVAGLAPAAVIALCLMVLIYLLSLRRGPVATPVGPKIAWTRALGGAVLPLAMPVAMVIGIRFGIATPTEVSSFAVAYGIVLATVIYRESRLVDMLRHASQGATMAGVVLFVISAASSLAWVLSAANLPQYLVAMLHRVGDSPVLFMMGSIFLLIVIGSLLEGLPAIIILAPLLMPIAVQSGIDAVQYAIVLILAMGIGAFMPPIGIGFYVAVSVAGANLEGAARAMLPFLIVLILAVLLIAFVPSITLFLPRLLRN